MKWWAFVFILYGYGTATVLAVCGMFLGLIAVAMRTRRAWIAVILNLSVGAALIAFAAYYVYGFGKALSTLR
jgi:hypothetical protein